MSFDVITIGTATEDVYLVSEVFRGGKTIQLPLGSKLGVDEVMITSGGGATNAAVTFSRQGFRTATLAKVGDDIPGWLVEEELRREGVVPFLVHDKKERTAYSTILLARGGERTILVFRGASENLRAHDIPWRKLNTKWIYVSGGGISFSLLQKLVNFFYKKGALVAINLGKAQLVLGLRRLRPVIAKTKTFILNREEASRLTGVPYGNEKKIFEVLDRAIGGVLVITDGKRGAKVSDGVSRWHAGIFEERRLVDRTGAGDSFGAGFVAGLMQKGEKCEKGVCKPANIAYALRLATANATSNVESIGPKSGILTRSAFRASRWRRLRVIRS